MTWHRLSTSAKRRKKTFRYWFPIWVGIIHSVVDGTYGLWLRLWNWRVFIVYWQRPMVVCLDCLCKHRRGAHVDRTALHRARGALDERRVVARVVDQLFTWSRAESDKVGGAMNPPAVSLWNAACALNPDDGDVLEIGRRKVAS